MLSGSASRGSRASNVAKVVNYALFSALKLASSLFLLNADKRK